MPLLCPKPLKKPCGNTTPQRLARAGPGHALCCAPLCGPAAGSATLLHRAALYLQAHRLRKLGATKLNEETARALVEALGYAGILQPAGHPAHRQQFIPGQPPRKSANSDWAYAVDFWRGADGLNQTAVQAWFAGFL